MFISLANFSLVTPVLAVVLTSELVGNVGTGLVAVWMPFLIPNHQHQNTEG